MRIDKDTTYMAMAEALAGRSTCLDKQVGCILTDKRGIIIGSGYNGAPRGMEHCTFCKVAEGKNNKDLCPSAHAEQNALLTCTDPDRIHTVYVTLSPCINCIRVLLNTGAERIIFGTEHKHREPKNLWLKSGKEFKKWTLKL